MPLINTNPEIQSIQGIKHFTWDDIVMFGEKNDSIPKSVSV